MTVTSYLTYYGQAVVGSNTFYYLRAVFLPTDFTSTLLVNLIELLSGADITKFVNIPVAAPAKIASGTNCYHIDGTSWSAPDDLYLIAVHDFPMYFGTSPGSVPLSSYIGNAPLLVYVAVKPYTLTGSDLPSFLSVNAIAAQLAGQQWFEADGWNIKTVTTASRKNTYPFWTTINFHYTFIYNGCTYDPDATPDYNLHVTLTMNKAWYVQFISGGGFAGQVYWKHDGHRYKIDSCNSSIDGVSIWEDSGTVLSVGTYIYLADEPVQWFSPEFVFGRTAVAGSTASALAFSSMFHVPIPFALITALGGRKTKGGD